MTNTILPSNSGSFFKENQPLEILLLLTSIKKNIWLIGIPFLIWGMTERGIAAFADNISSIDKLMQLLITFFFCICWLCLKPETPWTSESHELASNEQTLPHIDQQESHLSTAHTRMLELKEYHLISQAYSLPFPYLCQIYHLLNLKHLENIHSFSLNNLKITGILHCQPTVAGGVIKFQTILEAPVNVLRIWRKPAVEVELILHTPFTVELKIPVYNDKYITVIFNVFPLSTTQHKLFIDIYSNLKWYKPLLQIILHIASCLTLFEDLPYLRTLATRNLDRLMKLNPVLSHETQWLFKRFVDLYGSNLEPARETVAISS